MRWFNFFRKGSDVEPQPPTTASLYSEKATEQMIELLTMPEMDYVLQQAGINRWDLAKLESDDEIFQGLRTRRDAVVSTPWRFEPGQGNVVDFLTEELTPIIEQLVAHAWKAVPYGYNVQEVVYKKRYDGLIGIDRVVEKPMRWFEPRPDMTLQYRPAMDLNATPETLDTRYKFLLCQHDPTYENPMGEALLSRLYWPWFFRFNGWRFWSQFLERFGQPLLIGKAADPTAMATALAAAFQDAVIAHGLNDEVTIGEPKNEGRSFTYYEQALVVRIQKLILGQTLTSGSGSADSGASYALGVIHNSVRDDLRKADLRMIKKVVQILVNALCALNFPTRIIPTFKFDDGTGLGKDRAERDKSLFSIGVNFTKQYFINNYDLVDGDFDLDENARNNKITSDQAVDEDGNAVPTDTQGEKVNTSTKANGEKKAVSGAPSKAPKAAKEGVTK